MTYRTIYAALLFLAIAGCDSGDANDIEARECHLSVTASPPAAATAKMSAQVTGEAEITSITYDAGGGEKTVSEPTLPWSRTFEVGAKTNLSLTAEASVTKGAAEIKLDVVADGDDDELTVDIHQSDDCSQD